MLFILGKACNFSAPKLSFPASAENKESARNAGDPSSIPGSGRSPGEENDNPLQYSGLEDPHGQRSLADYSPWGREESDTTEPLHASVFKVSSQVALVIKNPPANTGDKRGWLPP